MNSIFKTRLNHLLSSITFITLNNNATGVLFGSESEYKVNVHKVKKLLLNVGKD